MKASRQCLCYTRQVGLVVSQSGGRVRNGHCTRGARCDCHRVLSSHCCDVISVNFPAFPEIVAQSMNSPMLLEWEPGLLLLWWRLC